VKGSTLIVGALAAVATFVVLLDVIATVALIRATELRRWQKVIQAIFVWTVPVLGANLVVRFLAESEPSAVSVRWIPNETINAVVLGALGVTVKRLAQVSEAVLEQEVIGLVSHHFSSGEAVASHDSVGHSDGGGHGGH